MSLVGTLGRIAVGVMVAKGVGKMVSKGGGSGGGLGDLLGSALGGNKGGAGGGLGDLGGLLGGGNAQAGGQTQGGLPGGLGGLLESIGGGAGGAAGGGLSGGQGGGFGSSAPAGGSLGDLLNSALQGKKTPPPAPAQEDQAKVLIRAMINAAKSDGKIDQAEQQKIVEHLGDEVSDEERKFVISEMQSPLDTDGLLRNVPKGAEMQVYMMSLLGIDLDSREEAQYLDGLRKSMGISEQHCNAIHEKLGVPVLYS